MGLATASVVGKAMVAFCSVAEALDKSPLSGASGIEGRAGAVAPEEAGNSVVVAECSPGCSTIRKLAVLDVSWDDLASYVPAMKRLTVT